MDLTLQKLQVATLVFNWAATGDSAINLKEPTACHPTQAEGNTALCKHCQNYYDQGYAEKLR